MENEEVKKEEEVVIAAELFCDACGKSMQHEGRNIMGMIFGFDKNIVDKGILNDICEEYRGLKGNIERNKDKEGKSALNFCVTCMVRPFMMAQRLFKDNEAVFASLNSNRPVRE